MLAYLNGSFIPRTSATISVEDRGFIFGDGVYEVWRAIDGHLFEADRHLARLASGLDELRIPRPDLADRARLLEVATHLLGKSGLSTGEGTLYVQITRGVAPRAHQFPSPGTPPTVYATVNRLKPVPELRASGVACITVPDVRWMRCDIKTIQLLPNVLARQAAAEQGVFEAVMIRGDRVTEGSHTNVMGVLDGAIRTHPTNQWILPGVTRTVVLEIAAAAGMTVVEEPLSEGDLERVDELFLTSTTTDVMPIVRIDGRSVGSGTPGPVAARLFRDLRAYLDAAAASATPAL